MGGNGNPDSCKAIHGMLFAYIGAGSGGITVKESCHRQDGLTKIKIPRGSAACEGRSIVCFVCVLVHLYSVEE